MGKIKLIIYSVILVAALYLQVDSRYIKEEGVTPELSSYWNKELKTIEDICSKKPPLPSRIYVDFGDTDEAIGYCQRFVNGFKIVIDKAYWIKLDEVGKDQLMLHEMMHCIYKMKHNTTDPENFMYPEYVKISKEVLLAQLAQSLKETDQCD
jgi:hypothetical protein